MNFLTLSPLSSKLTSCSSPMWVSMFKYEEINLSCQYRGLISAISALFLEIIKKNEKKKKKCIHDVFYNEAKPQLTIKEYLIRIAHYTNIDESVLIMIPISINNYIKKNKNCICINNVFRLILASVVINMKFYQDVNYSFQHYAKVGGVTIKELKELEYYFYIGINNSLYVNESLFKQYKNFFLLKSKRYYNEVF